MQAYHLICGGFLSNFPGVLVPHFVTVMTVTKIWETTTKWSLVEVGAC
jgi:hypothetical protein